MLALSHSRADKASKFFKIMAKLPPNISTSISGSNSISGSKSRHSFSEQRRTNIINAIHDCLEDGCSYSGKLLNEKEEGFLEDMSKDLSEGKDISVRQYDWLTDLIGFGFLQ